VPEATAPAADGVLLLDKPPGITSTRALAIAKRTLGASKAGHTGTLDPFATGLLPLVFGEATKFSRFLFDSAKSYEATLVLGAETDTGDIESPVRPTLGEIPFLAKIDEVVASFVGIQRQTPPMHSAVHSGGRRLYEYARMGVEVFREPREIVIYALQRSRLQGKELVLTVTCSKGTYVRVLAADIGRALGCGAYLGALRRTAVGPFRVEDATTLDELAAAAETFRRRLLPPDSLVAGLPRLDLPADGARRFVQGQVIPGPASIGGGIAAVFGPGSRFLGVAEVADGSATPLRLMAFDPKSPDFP
jgi:tRNA pseudouridine55 synthase